MIQDDSTEIIGWTLKTFGNCADLIRDSINPIEETADTHYIGLEHIGEGTLRLNGHGLAKEVESNKFRFKKGDILFGKLRPYFRKVVIAPFDGICSTDIWVVRARAGVDQRFLYYWMASQQFVDDTTRASEGTKMPRAKWGFASQLERYIPEYPEQHAIARVLGSLDDKIELNHRMNATLEAMAQAIFKSWFVDFDPVRAKMQGEEPAGMDAETAALFPDEFEVVDGQEVPKGWTKTTIRDFIEVIKGRSYKSAELQDSDKALVTLKSFQRRGGYREDGLKSYIGTFKPEQIILPGELIVAFTDVTQEAEVIGRPAIVSANPAFNTLIASLDVGIIRSKHQSINVPYLYNLFQSEDFQAHIAGYTSGTTVLHLAKDGIPSYQFIKPEDPVLDKYHEIAGPMFSLIEQNLQQSRTLAAIRDILLPKLISGEIRVPDTMLEAAET